MKKIPFFFSVIILLLTCVGFTTSVKFKLNNGDQINFSEFATFTGHIPGLIYNENDNTLFWQGYGNVEKIYEIEVDGDRFALDFQADEITPESTVIFSDFFQKFSLSREFLIDLLSFAHEEIWISIYDLDDRHLIKKLEELHERGIVLKIIIENDNYNSNLDYLYDEGLIKFDENPKLMHDKFIIIDGSILVTGSSNFTKNGFDNNSNNINVFYSNELSELFMQEFRLQEENFFGKSSRKKLTSTAEKEVIFTGDATVSTYFSASDDIKSNLINLINSCENTLEIMMFTFTDKDIANAIVEAASRNVEIRIILETFQAGSKWSVSNFLAENNVDFILDENPRVFHHKVMIIDNKYVVTGSYNYTISAQNYNDENILIVESSKFVEAYLECFNDFWEKWR